MHAKQALGYSCIKKLQTPNPCFRLLFLCRKKGSGIMNKSISSKKLKEPNIREFKK